MILTSFDIVVTTKTLYSFVYFQELYPKSYSPLFQNKFHLTCKILFSNYIRKIIILNPKSKIKPMAYKENHQVVTLSKLKFLKCTLNMNLTMHFKYESNYGPN